MYWVLCIGSFLIFLSITYFVTLAVDFSQVLIGSVFPGVLFFWVILETFSW